MLLRPCSHPGCPALVRSGRCPAHQSAHGVSASAPASSASASSASTPSTSVPSSAPRLRFNHRHKPFYNSRAWKRARTAYLCLHPICETCKRAPSTEVHHKASLEDIAAERIPEWVLRLGIDLELVDLRLDDRNFLAQCKSCHSRETVRQDGGFGRSPAPRKELQPMTQTIYDREKIAAAWDALALPFRAALRAAGIEGEIYSIERTSREETETGSRILLPPRWRVTLAGGTELEVVDEPGGDYRLIDSKDRAK